MRSGTVFLPVVSAVTRYQSSVISDRSSVIQCPAELVRLRDHRMEHATDLEQRLEEHLALLLSETTTVEGDIDPVLDFNNLFLVPYQNNAELVPIRPIIIKQLRGVSTTRLMLNNQPIVNCRRQEVQRKPTTLIGKCH